MAGAGLPWASVFDPVANARALQQVQRRGLKAAGELVDRLVSVVDGDEDFDATTTNGGPAGARPATSPGADLVGVWADLVTRTLQAMARLAVPDAGPPEAPTGGPVWVDIATGRGSGAVELSDGSPASPVEVWIHNPTHQGVGPLKFHVGELRSPDGAALAGDAVRLEPDVVEALPGRSSRAIRAAFCANEGVAAGCYRGLLQAAGAAEVAVPVEVTVTGPA
jgi:hypothetical protein